MANLSNSIKQKFEHLLGMNTGYVLDFTNASFQDFILTSTGIDIYKDNKYLGSKAQILRQFWQNEADVVVAKLMLEMLERWQTNKLMTNSPVTKSEEILYDERKAEMEKMLGKKTNNQKSSPPGDKIVYINPKLIEQFKNKKNIFNYSKLVGILNGLNRNYRDGDPYACSQLVKTLVNHIPPLLGTYRTFNEAASQFAWEKAHRPYIESIRGYVDEANDVTHTVISDFEDQASLDSLPKPIYLNTLLSICVVESDKNSPLQKSKPTKKLEAQKVSLPVAQNIPSIMLTEPEAVWASNYSNHGASFLVVIAVDNYGGRNDYIVDAKISGTNADGTSFKTDRFTVEGQQPNYPLPLKADEMQVIRIFIASDHNNHRPMPDLDRDTVKFSLAFRSGKTEELPIRIRQN